MHLIVERLCVCAYGDKDRDGDGVKGKGVVFQSIAMCDIMESDAKHSRCPCSYL